jgi:hypothetical protein
MRRAFGETRDDGIGLGWVILPASQGKRKIGKVILIGRQEGWMGR